MRLLATEIHLGFVAHLPRQYLAIYGWGGGEPLWFIIEDASVPDGIVRESVSVAAAEGGVDHASVDLSFEEFGR